TGRRQAPEERQSRSLLEGVLQNPANLNQGLFTQVGVLVVHHFGEMRVRQTGQGRHTLPSQRRPMELKLLKARLQKAFVRNIFRSHRSTIHLTRIICQLIGPTMLSAITSTTISFHAVLWSTMSSIRILLRVPWPR